MFFERLYRFFNPPACDKAEFEAFARFIFEKYWNEFKISRMDKLTNWFAAHPWPALPNAVENSTYEAAISLPSLPENTHLILKSVSGVDRETHGLNIEMTSDSFTVSGTPQLDKFREEGRTLQTEFTLVARFDFEGGSEYGKQENLEQEFKLTVNPDPHKLWKDLPVDWEKIGEPQYRHADEASDFLAVETSFDGTPAKHIVVASKRGRSHAHEGKPRDDAYRMHYCAENGWYVMAVSDGAGSASYSREGSRLACETAVECCLKKLADVETLQNIEAQISAYHQSESENISKVGEVLYHLLCSAAFNASKAIQAEAAKQQRDPRTYAATLLLSITKRFPFGWFVGTFWVGDGAIALYRRDLHEVKLMGEPDEGEYGGQTRFVTMPEIFQDPTACYKRLRFTLVDDFTALFLMSDGVSDAKFETTNNLKNPQKWDELWENLEHKGVGLTTGEEVAKNQLLSWLDFWSPGNYDDRTIAVLCGKEAPSSDEKTSAVADEVSKAGSAEASLEGPATAEATSAETSTVYAYSAAPHEEPTTAETTSTEKTPIDTPTDSEVTPAQEPASEVLTPQASVTAEQHSDAATPTAPAAEEKAPEEKKQPKPDVETGEPTSAQATEQLVAEVASKETETASATAGEVPVPTEIADAQPTSSPCDGEVTNSPDAHC